MVGLLIYLFVNCMHVLRIFDNFLRDFLRYLVKRQVYKRLQGPGCQMLEGVNKSEILLEK